MLWTEDSVGILSMTSILQKGVIVDPGRVPDEWAPRLDDAQDDNNYDGQTPLLPRRLLEIYKARPVRQGMCPQNALPVGALKTKMTRR